MDRLAYEILLSGPGRDGAEVPPTPVGKILAATVPTVKQAISLGFVGLCGGDDGATILRFEAPRLGDAAEELYRQPEFRSTRPDGDDTGFDLLPAILHLDPGQIRRDDIDPMPRSREPRLSCHSVVLIGRPSGAMSMSMSRMRVYLGSLVAAASACLAPSVGDSTCAGAEDPKGGITHGFLATGGETYIRDGKGEISWRYPHPTRDGWALPGGTILLALSKSPTYPGGGAVEVGRDGKVLFEFKGSQSEVNTAQKLAGDLYLISEAGDRPRLLEVARDGRVKAEVPLKAQIGNHHLQTRMARKLANGNYLVPQLLDKVVREYKPGGEVAWEVKTPDMPFTAIRLPDGHTLIGCTVGNLVIEVDADGKTVWSISNDDLPGRPINDACGVQRLPGGHTVITSYRAGGGEVKLAEVTPGKDLVWVHRDATTPGIHTFQILDTNGRAIEGPPLR